MAVDGMPWGVDGNVAGGLGLPLRGVVHGLRGEVQSVSDVGGVLAHVVPPVEVVGSEATLSGALVVELYQDGSAVGVADGEGNWVVPGGVAGVWSEIGPLPATVVEAAQAPLSGTWWVARPVGQRACITWEDQPEDADLVGYVLYWDEGDDEAPEVELARVLDPDARQYRTAVLAAGTYRFRLEYVDAAGNVSDVGVEQSVRVQPVPAEVVGLELDYDDATRRATLTWTPPAVDGADVRCYLVMDNWVPGGDELGPAPNSEVGQERGVVYASPGDGEQTWESVELWAGVWRFGVRGLSADGVLGGSAELVLHLQLDGGDLVEVLAPPDAPELLSVEAIAGGAYRARVRVADESDLTALWLLEDGVEVEEVTLTGAGEYTVESGTFAHDTEVLVQARSYVSATVSATSGGILHVADAEAPDGDGEITAEACW